MTSLSTWLRDARAGRRIGRDTVPTARLRPDVPLPGNRVSLRKAHVISLLPLVLLALVALQDPLSLLAHGALILSTAFVVSAAFALLRRQPIDRDWSMHGVLFAAVLPLSMPPQLLVYGTVTGVALGALIFGGSGRYIVSPLVIGVILIQQGFVVDVQALPLAFSPAAMIQPDATSLAELSLPASLIGLLLMWVFGIASLPTVLSATLAFGLITASTESIAVGASVVKDLGLPAFVFCLAFPVSDPSASAMTPLGRWLYGAVFGALSAWLIADAASAMAGALSACLVASLLAPLLDHASIRFALYRRRRRIDE